MTGTPDGVALGMAEPKWLRYGDVVEVEIDHLASCVNKIVEDVRKIIISVCCKVAIS
jgi:2-keto-4-pentenoate hydratase/2-oxohepta-3-ene-1,7-dioic acid hydratase in catechol pathway